MDDRPPTNSLHFCSSSPPRLPHPSHRIVISAARTKRRSHFLQAAFAFVRLLMGGQWAEKFRARTLARREAFVK